jgi:ketosteroid isomerase-like protein
MKHVLLGMVFGLAVSAVVPVSGADDAAISAVKAVDRNWGEAYVACTTKVWESLLAEDLVFIHNNGSIDGKAKQMASIASCGIESLKASVTSVRVYGADTAVVIGKMQGKVKGGDFRFDLLYTRVYIQEKGAWRLVSHQSTDAPKKAAGA